MNQTQTLSHRQLMPVHMILNMITVYVASHKRVEELRNRMAAIKRDSWRQLLVGLRINNELKMLLLRMEEIHEFIMEVDEFRYEHRYRAELVQNLEMFHRLPDVAFRSLCTQIEATSWGYESALEKLMDTFPSEAELIDPTLDPRQWRAYGTKLRCFTQLNVMGEQLILYRLLRGREDMRCKGSGKLLSSNKARLVEELREMMNEGVPSMVMLSKKVLQPHRAGNKATPHRRARQIAEAKRDRY